MKITFCGYDDTYKAEWTPINCKHLVKCQWLSKVSRKIRKKVT